MISDIGIFIEQDVTDGERLTREGAVVGRRRIRLHNIHHRGYIGGDDVDIRTHLEEATQWDEARLRRGGVEPRVQHPQLSTGVTIHFDALHDAARRRSHRAESGKESGQAHVLRRGTQTCRSSRKHGSRRGSHDEQVRGGVTAEDVQLDQQTVLVPVVAPLAEAGGAIIIDLTLPSTSVVLRLVLTEGALEDGTGRTRSERSDTERHVVDTTPLTGEEATPSGGPP